jgi:hypothetical protein
VCGAVAQEVTQASSVRGLSPKRSVSHKRSSVRGVCPLYGFGVLDGAG